eukprot:6292100-Prymnesium_polylepis.1
MVGGTSPNLASGHNGKAERDSAVLATTTIAASTYGTNATHLITSRKPSFKLTVIRSSKYCPCSFVIATTSTPTHLSLGHGTVMLYTPGAV